MSLKREGLLAELQLEMAAATRCHGPFNSTHEAYGVLAEEVAELLDAIRANELESVRAEAMQVAATAVRLAAQCRGDRPFATRSGT